MIRRSDTSGFLVLAFLVQISCAPTAPIEVNQAGGIEPRDTALVHAATTPTLDTLTVGPLKFIPLRAFLETSTFMDYERKFITAALSRHELTLDSMWVIPRAYQHMDDMIELELHKIDGILEEIDLERRGVMRNGNWSGRDGVLWVNTGSPNGESTYALFQ